MNVGVDIEEISRFEYRSEALLNRIFTKQERAYCMAQAKPAQHFCGRFCAKEAVIKALSGYGIKGIFLSDIEVYHDKNDCPQVRLLKKIKKRIKLKVSISHDKTKAIAFVVAER